MRLKIGAAVIALCFAVVGTIAAQPVITDVSLDISPDSVIVTITTDIATTATVDYGLDTNYGSQESDPTLATSHVIVLSGLAESTLYHFQVTVIDGSLNQTQDPDDTFTTESYPVMSNLSVDAVTEHTATVSFDTDKLTISDFWIRPVGGPSEHFLHYSDGIYRTSHTVVLDTLYLESAPNSHHYRPAAGLEYEFAAIATDADGNSIVDSSGTFTTPAHPNDTFIDGWLTADVGSQTLVGFTQFDASDSSFYMYSSGTSLFNKKDRHHYLYRAMTGNFDLTARLSYYAGMMFSHSKGAALFRSGLNTDSEIYSQSINYESDDLLYYRSAPNVEHTLVIRTQLQAENGDAIWVRMLREGNDFTVWYSDDGQTWNLHGPAAVNVALPLAGYAGIAALGHVDDYYGELGVDNLVLTAVADTIAPMVTSVDATPINNTATIDYETNEWVQTTLEYGTTMSYGTEVVTSGLHTTNSIDLTGLLYDTEYHYRMKAYDSDSNEVVLGDMTFMTEPENPLAVELAGFSGRILRPGEVQLNWSILSSDGIARFDVEHKRGAAFQVVESVAPIGDAGDAGDYSVRVEDVDYGAQTFRLRIVELDGAITYSPEVELMLELPGGFVVTDLYPNPFTSTTGFTLTVRETQPVTVEVYNLAGQRVGVVFDGVVDATSPRRFEFDGSGLAGGVYFYRVRGENFVATDRMVLVK